MATPHYVYPASASGASGKGLDDDASPRPANGALSPSAVAKEIIDAIPQLPMQVEGLRTEQAAMREDFRDIERELESIQSEMAQLVTTGAEQLRVLQRIEQIIEAREERESAEQLRRQQIDDARREREIAWEEEDRQRRLAREDEEHGLQMAGKKARSDAEVLAISDRAKLRSRIAGVLFGTSAGGGIVWLIIEAFAK